MPLAQVPGMMMSSDWPHASVAVKPDIRVAPRFQ
jgi:hypothetical protein